MSLKTTRIEGQRLDVVLQRIRERDGPSAILDIEPAKEFAHDDVAYRAPLTSAESLLIDFIMPMISDPAIFQDSNTILLLEYLRDDILPSLDNDELTDLATKVIDDEILRHDFVREHRQSAIAT